MRLFGESCIPIYYLLFQIIKAEGNPASDLIWNAERFIDKRRVTTFPSNAGNNAFPDVRHILPVVHSRSKRERRPMLETDIPPLANPCLLAHVDIDLLFVQQLE